MVGMFGQNDNPQASDLTQKNSGQSSPPPANPFGENDAPVPPTAPSTDASNPAPIVSDPVAPTPLNDPEPPAGDDLLNLKQQALQQLQPLVSHLEQSPEEKFKTTMMLIQATDNPSLVKQAYDAANLIPDQKARAQALLDVVNEINYFTHKDKE